MKVLLMHPDRDFHVREPLPWNEEALVQDLQLQPLLQAMARGDALILEVTRRALLGGWRNGRATVLYRQAVLQDGLSNPVALRELYALAVEAIEGKRKLWLGTYSRYAPSVLHGAVERMQMFLGILRRLRDTARVNAAHVRSEGLRSLFAMLERELTDQYLEAIEAHLEELGLARGVLISAGVGPGNAVRNHVLHRLPKDERSWLKRLFTKRQSAYTFRLPDRDEAGARALSELRSRGIHVVAKALAQSADHVESFFQVLRTELAFYVGCVNLAEQLRALGEPTCFPHPHPTGETRSRALGLYDPCLALQMWRAVVGNTLETQGKSLVIITGANQGGKSSFLRAVGVAQLMMQCGMFVAAEAFEGGLRSGLGTHFKREEDATLTSGKLDEELSRMSEIVDHLAPNSMLLFNESFAATNEREGSEIARQVVSALQEDGLRVFFVTHLHAFARAMFESPENHALFLRAERLPDGTRTFRMLEGEPLATAHGRDLYERIFGPRVHRFDEAAGFGPGRWAGG